jgi:hypothetical protein
MHIITTDTSPQYFIFIDTMAGKYKYAAHETLKYNPFYN